MNAVSEPGSPSSLISGESMQMLAQWLKCNGGIKVNKSDPHRLILDRYPEGLLSRAEIEALLGSFHH
ncbi:MAG: hypothetical protein PW845_24825 [Pseudomonas sp.]|uniref:hypothetical protein n=1 Tax=Pseudomonas abieticivorans TaxID=2931382 RepID=UPI0020C0D0F7|nr:hypothetical protein [Pseudomonas sp. PIA16]MDE1168512.1 hypothetical protein [Pseudomonas sp.]